MVLPRNQILLPQAQTAIGQQVPHKIRVISVIRGFLPVPSDFACEPLRKPRVRTESLYYSPRGIEYPKYVRLMETRATGQVQNTHRLFMSYSAYITRNVDYPYLRNVGAQCGTAIMEQEWNTIVSRDDSLRSCTGAPHSAHWEGAALPFRFDPVLGEVEHRDPTPAVIGKMIEIAESLGASVRGGDGEFWQSGTEFTMPDHEDFKMPAPRSRVGLLIDQVGSYALLLIGFIGIAIGHVVFQHAVGAVLCGVGAMGFGFFVLITIECFCGHRRAASRGAGRDNQHEK